MDRRSLDYSAQQRAGILVYWLACGERLTVREVAAKLGVTPHGAHDMLRNIARAVPIVNEDGRWQAARNAQDARETAKGASTPQRPAAHVLDVSTHV